MKEIIYNKCLIARMVIETETPLAIGSGEKDIMTDKLVVKDVNGMPYIPGSSLAGVLRHSIKDFNRPDSIFGFQKGNKGKGSRILFTDGVMLGEDGIALDGLQQIPNTAFYERYSNLPIRQHVRMNESGTAEDKGKFDEQVVFKGTRFVFEMELVYTSLENAEEPEDEKTFNAILKNLCFKTLRFGSGTRNGFGNRGRFCRRSAGNDIHAQIAGFGRERTITENRREVRPHCRPRHTRKSAGTNKFWKFEQFRQFCSSSSRLK